MEHSRDPPDTTKQLYSTDLWQNSKKKKKYTRRGKKYFQQMMLEQLDVYIKRANLYTDLASFTNITATYIIDLNLKWKTTNLL